MPYRPRLNDTIDIVADFYDAVASGTDNIVAPITWNQNLNDTYTGVKFWFDYDDLANDPRLEYRGLTEATLANSTNYNGWQAGTTLKSAWVKDQNEAQIIAQRWLGNHNVTVWPGRRSLSNTERNAQNRIVDQCPV